jgi:hypothetical protein
MALSLYLSPALLPPQLDVAIIDDLTPAAGNGKQQGRPPTGKP